MPPAPVEGRSSQIQQSGSEKPCQLAIAASSLRIVTERVALAFQEMPGICPDAHGTIVTAKITSRQALEPHRPAGLTAQALQPWGILAALSQASYPMLTWPSPVLIWYRSGAASAVAASPDAPLL